MREIVLAPDADPSSDPALPLRVAVASGESGLPINPVTLSNLTRCPMRDHDWNAEERALLIRLLSCGANLPEVWERLDYVGVPGRWMPEWLGIRNRPSVSAAHRYTIDQHMIQSFRDWAAAMGGPTAMAVPAALTRVPWARPRSVRSRRMRRCRDCRSITMTSGMPRCCWRDCCMTSANAPACATMRPKAHATRR